MPENENYHGNRIVNDKVFRKRLIFWYDKKIPDYFSVAGAP